jgi:LmeA-like phospholipid-binding
MELLTILLSALLGILSPVGVVVDNVAARAIRDQLNSAEDLAVRVDNAPSYQLLQGRVDRIRIAGQGLFPVAGVRIAALEVETDPIAVNSSNLRRGQLQLEQPLQAGVRLVLNQDDLNQALRSPAVRNLLQNLNLGQLGAGSAAQGYEVVDPQIELTSDRIQLQAVLQEISRDQTTTATGEQLAIVLESGLSVQSGHQIQLVNPTVSINGQAIPGGLIQGLAAGLSRQFDLQNFQANGITARILQLEITPGQLQLAVFVRVEPGASNISSNISSSISSYISRRDGYR